MNTWENLKDVILLGISGFFLVNWVVLEKNYSTPFIIIKHSSSERE